MSFPDWVDPQWSADLPTLRSRGENQELEYISSFPSNVRDLAREVAAFATSHGGTILLGITDSGELRGLPNVDNAEGRDALVRRIEGICRGTVKPAITPLIRFALEAGKAVAVIVVPKGSEPIYYSGAVPYIRHVTESRPAEPHEVVELVRAWLPAAAALAETETPNALAELLSRLATVLIDVLLYGEEYDDREVNPWFDQWRSQYRYCANQLRELALEDAAIREGIASECVGLADALDEITSSRVTLGGGADLRALLEAAMNLAVRLKRSRVDTFPLSATSLQEVRTMLVQRSRRLQALVDRREHMSERNQEDEFQSEASEIGQSVLRLSYYNLDNLGTNVSEKLRDIGRRLHLLETVDTGYSDGGRAVQHIFDTAESAAKDLDLVVRAMSDHGSSPV